MPDLAVVVPGVLGAVCMLVVCAVFLGRRRLGPGGALLSLCGLTLLGLAYWQVVAPGPAAPDLARRLDEIGASLARLEAQIAEIGARQTEPAAAGIPRSDTDTTPPAGGQDDVASAAPAVQEDAAAVGAPVLEIEVRGSLSQAELASIVAWIEEVKAERPSARVAIAPVMPLQSADPAGGRAMLMSEAGRVIDHVFVALRQRVDIGSLVSEDVPAPRLRLALSDA
jgi:hypothetical protein